MPPARAGRGRRPGAAHGHTFLGKGLRDRARCGAIGYHPSLLPRHRGRDAVRWAVKMGDAVTGGTVYQLTDTPDAGPILAQHWCWVYPSDTPKTLWRDRLAPLGLDLLRAVLLDLGAGRLRPVAQDERAATWEPAFSRPPLASQAP